ncbi:Cse1-domain-containing protein [Polychaeton citri CBS 116435]|uniref:Cse1-domain-containing protein n=1 Tax=Polychaeton citri CBS 116435 TaxID=1314669 RepID=A0A9P4Q2F6_9PEZI|nr:Cse1-domain-containing protein [Polychaeton citri CBS 116435]
MAAAADLQNIAALLQASLDPSQNRQAEVSLKQEEIKPGFSLALLQIVNTETFPPNTRLASALFFKNFVRRNWADENGEHKLPQNEVSTIKSELIGLMVKVPGTIQAQLGDAISVIAECDFYERWDTLVDDLVSRLTPDNSQQNNGVLQVAHSIFKRWEPLYRTDDLFTEINHVLSKFAKPFLQLWQQIDQNITQSQASPDALKAQFSTLDLIVKLFYDLSTQDLPPDFEDNLGAVAHLLHKYLTYDNASLHTDDDEEPGILESVRAGTFRALVLYAKKYEDAFGPHLGQFISSSWAMLTNVGPELKYDLVVSRALEFLTTVAGISQHAQNFNNAEILGQVIEKVVLPNLSLRESDIELFEDEPIEFIRRDLEGSDEDTRRRAATNFLKKLMENFEKLVTDVVMKYVNHFLAEYAKDRKGNWKAKDTAVHLYSSIAAKGTATAAKGVLSINPNTNVLDFFQNTIAEDLTNGDAELLLKVDAIKYLYIFRSILSAQQWQAAFPLLVQHLNFSNYVVYTYAAIAVDRALYLTDEQRQPIIPRESIVPLSKDLLQHLFKLVAKDSKPEKVQENEFLMKCVMRVLIVIKDAVQQILDMVLTNLVTITRVIRHNPSNPGFCYYHFESIGALIRFAGPANSDKIESALFPVFMEILQGQVEDFTPYVFQLFAQIVATGSGPLSNNMQQLVQPVLSLALWDSKGNVPALSRLLCNILPRGAEQVAAANQTEAVLVIFQKLISSKAYEGHAMDLIEAVVTNFPVTALEDYWKTILQLLFTKLSGPPPPTENFILRFVKFYHLISANVERGLGADFFISVADQVQADVFTAVYTRIILPNTQKLSRPFDRKMAVISLARTIGDSQAFAERYAKKGWGWTCEALLKLLINPPLPPSVDDVIEDRDTDDLSFGAAFTPLQTCKRLPQDPWLEVQDVKRWVGLELRAADQRHAGRVSRYVDEKLDPQGKQALKQVMASG